MRGVAEERQALGATKRRAMPKASGWACSGVSSAMRAELAARSGARSRPAGPRDRARGGAARPPCARSRRSRSGGRAARRARAAGSRTGRTAGNARPRGPRGRAHGRSSRRCPIADRTSRPSRCRPPRAAASARRRQRRGDGRAIAAAAGELDRDTASSSTAKPPTAAARRSTPAARQAVDRAPPTSAPLSTMWAKGSPGSTSPSKVRNTGRTGSPSRLSVITMSRIGCAPASIAAPDAERLAASAGRRPRSHRRACRRPGSRRERRIADRHLERVPSACFSASASDSPATPPPAMTTRQAARLAAALCGSSGMSLCAPAGGAVIRRHAACVFVIAVPRAAHPRGASGVLYCRARAPHRPLARIDRSWRPLRRTRPPSAASGSPVICGAVILTIGIGARQSFGIFQKPIAPTSTSGASCGRSPTRCRCC